MKDFGTHAWTYAAPLTPQADHPKQIENRQVVSDSYALISADLIPHMDLDQFPQWEKTQFWTLLRPSLGQVDRFSHHIGTVAPNGGSTSPEPNYEAQGVLFVVSGELVVNIEDETATLSQGGFCYVPSGSVWALANISDTSAVFHWVRKTYEMDDALAMPAAVFGKDTAIQAVTTDQDAFPDKLLVDAGDAAQDMRAKIITRQPNSDEQVTLQSGETHYCVLQGVGTAHVNGQTVALKAGDFLTVRAGRPHRLQMTGTDPMRLLTYNSCNRVAQLDI